MPGLQQPEQEFHEFSTAARAAGAYLSPCRCAFPIADDKKSHRIEL
jgi:hypothetical protein